MSRILPLAKAPRWVRSAKGVRNYVKGHTRSGFCFYEPWNGSWFAIVLRCPDGVAKAFGTLREARMFVESAP